MRKKFYTSKLCSQNLNPIPTVNFSVQKHSYPAGNIEQLTGQSLPGIPNNENPLTLNKQLPQ